MSQYTHINILLVDDNPADLLYLREIIEDDTNLRLTIFEASNIEEAKKVINEEEIDLVFLDLFLPDSSGVDTFKIINKLQTNLSIIILSGLQNEQVALETVRSGAQDFILKGEYDGKLLEKAILYSIERKKNEELLRVSNQKYIELFQNSPLALFIIKTSEDKFIQSNSAATKMLGYSYKEFKHMNYDDVFLSENILNGKKYHVAQRKDGKKIFTNIVKQNIESENSETQLVQVEDLTEKIKFERDRMDIINEIQDDERQNFAMELHDGLAQELVLIKLYAEQIEKSSSNKDELKMINEIVDSTLMKMRRITYSVAPPLLDEGFLVGLKVLFERFRKVSKVDVELKIHNEHNVKSNLFNPEITHNAFRIIQEALNNSIKHSEASKIHSTVTITDDNVVIVIEDNGNGFDTNNVSKRGMGLGNITKRSELYNMSHSIESEIGKGTKLTLIAPRSQINTSTIKE